MRVPTDISVANGIKVGQTSVIESCESSLFE